VVKVTFTLVEERTTTKLRWRQDSKAGIWKAHRKVGFRWTREPGLDAETTARMANRVSEFINAR
jgi:hypothetical protein